MGTNGTKKRGSGPTGNMKKVFQAASRLPRNPRSQQQTLLGVVGTRFFVAASLCSLAALYLLSRLHCTSCILISPLLAKIKLTASRRRPPSTQPPNGFRLSCSLSSLDTDHSEDIERCKLWDHSVCLSFQNSH